MLVKICGITNVPDAQEVERLGADFLGLNFVARSKRWVSVSQAREIVRSLEGRIVPVGVFADPDPEQVLDTVRSVGLDMIQLHGGEGPSLVDALVDQLPECRFWKSFGFVDRRCLDLMQRFYDRLKHRDRFFAFLLDGPWGGGAGRPFDWSALAEAIGLAEYETIRKKLFLAGGLHSQNVSQAIRMIDPLGVDVATGVEKQPGVKDRGKVEAFIRQAKQQPSD